MKDKLPCILEYIPCSAEAVVINGDAALKKVEVDGKTILFDFNGSLYDSGKITLTFEALVNGSTGTCTECGVCKNRANVTGLIWDECPPEEFLAEDSVNISSDNNCPPDPLWIKTENGPNGEPGDTISFTSKIYDPNDDQIKYKFKIGGCYEGEWSDWIESNTTIEFEYTFEGEGTYTVRIKAKDEHGLESDWECHIDIIIEENSEENHAPSTTGVGGDSEGDVDEELEFTTTISDPDDDQVKYQFRIDGDNQDWSELMEPGEITYKYTFDKKGKYDIQVRAEDENGAESDWSEKFEVEIGEDDDSDDDDDDDDEEAGLIDLIIEFISKHPVLKLLFGWIFGL